MELATVQVRMDNLKIEADIAVGSRGNPTVTNAFRNMAEVCTVDWHHTNGTLPMTCWSWLKVNGTMSVACCIIW